MRSKNIFLLPLFLVLVACGSALAHAQEKKTAYAVLIDNSGSLRTQFAHVTALGKNVVHQIHKNGSVSIFNFKTEGDKKNMLAVVTPGTEWSQDEKTLVNYIDALTVQPGQTTLYDAILAAAVQLDAKSKLDKEITRKVIVLLTDGEDRKSGVKAKELIEQLKEKGIQVYAVGFTAELDSERGMLRQSAAGRAKDFLRSITKETGGRVVFPESDADDVSEWARELTASR